MRNMLRSDEGFLFLVGPTWSFSWFDLCWGLIKPNFWWNWTCASTTRQQAVADEATWKHSLRLAGFNWIDWSRGRCDESKLIRLMVASPCENKGLQLQVGQSSEDDEHPDAGDKPLCEMETVAFEEVESVTLYADIFYPGTPDPAGTKPRPICLMVHGGGHVFYTRKDIRPDQRDLLLDLGFLPLTIDYRKCPETTLLNGPMIDATSALAWARQGLPGRLERPTPKPRSSA